MTAIGFFSYSRTDNESLGGVLRGLRDELQAGLQRILGERDLEIFLDEEGIQFGQEWQQRLDQAIDEAVFLFPVMSPAYLASAACCDEFRRFVRHEKQIMPDRGSHADGLILPISFIEEWKEQNCDVTTEAKLRQCLNLEELQHGGRTDMPEVRKLLSPLIKRVKKLLDSYPHLSRSRPPAGTPVLRDAKSPTTKTPQLQPQYRNDKERELCQRAARLRTAKRSLEGVGGNTDEIDSLNQQLRDIRHQLRFGTDLFPGAWLVERYSLIRKLGHGGFGSVWLAQDETCDKLVAVKVLLSHLVDTSDRRKRFQRGAEQMAALDHPHVVPVLAPYVEDGSFRFFVMEYMRGGSFLDAVINNDLTIPQRLRLIGQVAEALSFAHEKGIVHRDVTPDNILLSADMYVARLSDFDLVRVETSTNAMTKTGSVGKALYIAPEAFERTGADARFDVYSLGMTTIFALSGKQITQEVIRRTETFVRSLDCTTELHELLIQSIEYSPGDRPQNVEAFSDRLIRCLTKERSDSGTQVTVPSRASAAIARPTTAPTQAFRRGSDEFGEWAEFSVRGATQRLRWVPAGTFLMGSPKEEPERSKGEVQHEVTLSSGFWLADTACTQELWKAVMGENPSKFKGPQRPVERVSYEDVQKFLVRISDLVPDVEFNLPTEAQWEYACRAGTTTPFSFGETISTDEANFDGNYPYAGAAKGEYREQTVDCRAFPANAWGLFQMHGNVWEWCRDWYAKYSGSAEVDPVGPAMSSNRVIRGGSWIDYARIARSASRLRLTPGYRRNNLGFRCMSSASPVAEQVSASRAQPRDEAAEK